jgi:pimeloyl-ACP methyl ester carboxylesterase
LTAVHLGSISKPIHIDTSSNFMNCDSPNACKRESIGLPRTGFIASIALALIVWLAIPISCMYSAQARTGTSAPSKPSIVLVPGAYEDGSIWMKVIRLLQANGFHVTVVPIPLTSLAADAAMTKSVVARQQGPVILVGHSWGGVVITEAGNESNVIGLVYVAALAPDAGESSGDSLQHCPHKISLPIHTDEAGRKWIDADAYPEAWAEDLDIADARALAAVQRPIATQSFTDKITQAAWRTKPSWFQISANDNAQCAEVQRFMAKRMGAIAIELSASHASPLSHPDEVAKLIMDSAEKAGSTKVNVTH